jgi:hypothetical protein
MELMDLVVIIGVGRKKQFSSTATMPTQTAKVWALIDCKVKREEFRVGAFVVGENDGIAP